MCSSILARRDRAPALTGSDPADLSLSVLGVVVLAAALAALVDPLWRVLRLRVTLVHELGHAFVGMLVGRRFTGFVLRGDMSGHAVTVGPPRESVGWSRRGLVTRCPASSPSAWSRRPPGGMPHRC